MSTCIAVVPFLLVAVNAADCTSEAVKGVVFRAWTEAESGMGMLTEDSSMCSYVKKANACEEKTTEQVCMAGSDCYWDSSSSTCRVPFAVVFKDVLTPWTKVEASPAGKFFQTIIDCQLKKQSDCNNKCEWSEASCEVASTYYTDMCSNVDVKSMVDLSDTCSTSGTCTGDCESKDGNCQVKQAKFVPAMFGEFAETLVTAIDKQAACSIEGSEACAATCTKSMFGCGKQDNPIVTTLKTMDETCGDKTTEAECTSTCKWQYGTDCLLALSAADKECEEKGGYVDLAPSSFEPVPMLLSLIAMHVAAYV